MKHSIKHIAEYAALRAVTGLISALPYRAALAVGWILAWFAFHLVGFRADVAKARVRQVLGPGVSASEVKRIAWLACRNFFFCAVDLTRIPKLTLEWVHSHVVEYQPARDTLRKHLATGKGAILACPHMGAWEMAGAVAKLVELPVFFLAAPQKNSLANAYLNRLRSSTGVDVIQRGSSRLKTVITRLREGCILAFPPDVRAPTEEISVRFLGGVANVAGGLSLFASHTGVPIFTAIVTRVGWSRHRMRVLDPIWPNPSADKTADCQRITQEVFSRIEQAIRAEPEQWFWYNKRWILDPL